MFKFSNINLSQIFKIFKISGWIILFLTNWKIAVGLLCVIIGERIENDLSKQSILNIINNILSSLKSLIKRDDITEESQKIKNN